MPKATVDGTVIVETDDTTLVEGNHYFPLSAVADGVLDGPTGHETVCGWKGTAAYFDVVVGDVRHENAAWTYPTPMAGAEQVADRVAFYPVVTVSG